MASMDEFIQQLAEESEKQAVTVKENIDRVSEVLDELASALKK
jgi:hypothetical protein